MFGLKHGSFCFTRNYGPYESRVFKGNDKIPNHKISIRTSYQDAYTMRYRQLQAIFMDRLLHAILAPVLGLAEGIEYALSAQCPQRFWKMATVFLWIVLGHGLATGIFAATWLSGLGMFVIALSTYSIWTRRVS